MAQRRDPQRYRPTPPDQYPETSLAHHCCLLEFLTLVNVSTLPDTVVTW